MGRVEEGIVRFATTMEASLAWMPGWAVLALAVTALLAIVGAPVLVQVLSPV